MKRILKFLGFLVVAAVLGDVAIGVATASRNSSGTYSLPSGNPVVSGTTITTSWANTTLSDLATETTNSLDRQGRGAMLAPLQLSSGTSTAPGLTFSSETNSGLYRAGAGDLRLQIAGTQIEKWTGSTATFPIGLTATQSTTNANAINASGNGTGNGVSGTGGSNSGAGLYGTGGSPNGNGVTGMGTGTASGVVGTGGSSNGTGLMGQGVGTGTGASGIGGSDGGVGVVGTGGANNGLGGVFFGGTPNGTGVGATGMGGGFGAKFTGGATGGGVQGTAGGASQDGVLGTGVSGGIGVHAQSSVTNAPVLKADGYIDLSGSSTPSSGTGFTNILTPLSFAKATARLATNGSGGISIVSGYNVASVSLSASDTATLNFTNGMANTNYVVVASATDGRVVSEVSPSRTTGSISLHAYGIASALPIDLSAGALTIDVVVFGAQ